jgi:prepilin-type N-terminal cleavage/methylation domain
MIRRKALIMGHKAYKFWGFTLIELVITVAIIAILTTIAIPGYQQYLIRSNRVAAEAQMMEIANRQQLFMVSDRSYADKEKLELSGYTLPAEVASKYDYEITLDSSKSLPGFLITFIPQGSQSIDGELTLDSAGIKTPLEKW